MRNDTAPDRVQQIGDPSAIDAGMARHEGLVHAVLRRQWGGTLSYEERLQAGRIGLWHALQRYDPAYGTTFATYAWPAIAHEIWRAVRQAAPVPVVGGELPAVRAEPAAAVLAGEVTAALDTLVERLPAAERAIVIRSYGLRGEPPRSLRHLARALGCSHEAVRLRRWGALVWLRQPAHSLALRHLLDRNTAADYDQADALAQRWLRRRGGRRGG